MGPQCTGDCERASELFKYNVIIHHPFLVIIVIYIYVRILPTCVVAPKRRRIILAQRG